MQLKQYFILILFFSLTCLNTVKSQNSSVRKARIAAKPAYMQLDIAKTNIDLASKDRKTMHYAKTWFIRGDVYLKITTTTNNNYKNLAENPIDEALYSFRNAFKFDLKRKYTKSVKQNLEILKGLYRNEGIDCFNSGKYDRSYYCFNNILEINSIIQPKVIDTLIIYNLAMVAELNNMPKEAKKYYEQCIKYQYGGPKVYRYISQIAKQCGDTLAYINYLKQGIERYPAKNDTLLLELINYYIESDNTVLALQFLSKAVSKDSLNKVFYFAQGALFEGISDFENAILAYKKAVEIDSMYFDAYFNIGALYFNRGADILRAANNISPSEELNYLNTVQKAHVLFEKALPYLEKSHLCRPEDFNSMNILRDIYLKLRNENEKYLKQYLKYNDLVNKQNKGAE